MVAKSVGVSTPLRGWRGVRFVVTDMIGLLFGFSL
jgi:hypothetical protein